MRGHDVALYEASDKLGGQFNLAMVIPGKEEYAETIQYYYNMLQKYQVRVIMNQYVDAQLFSKHNFDEIILANGIKPRKLTIEGSDHVKVVSYIDILENEPYNCPQKPFGGDEDYIWNPDSKNIIYVSKKLKGTQAAQSTNTDLYQYNIETRQTNNLTESNKGYDTQPTYSVNGDLAYLSMKTDGFEADKNDIKVLYNGITTNLTAQWDESVQSYIWANDGTRLYFTAAVDGTLQLFEVDPR